MDLGIPKIPEIIPNDMPWLPWLTDDIPSLILLLGSEDDNERHGSIRALDRVASEQALALFQEAVSASEDARWLYRAVREWGTGRHEYVVPGLVYVLWQYMDGQDKYSIRTVCEGLVGCKATTAVGDLCAAYPAADPYAQEWIVYALGQIGDPRGLPTILTALGNENKDVETQAIDAINIWELSSPIYAPHYLEAISQVTPLAGLEAIAKLEVWRYEPAVPVLIEIIKSGSDLALSIIPYRALASIGTPQAIEFLKSIAAVCSSADDLFGLLDWSLSTAEDRRPHLARAALD